MSESVVQEIDAEFARRPERCASDKWRLIKQIGYGVLVAAQFLIVALMIAKLKSPGHQLVASVVQLSGVGLGLSAILTMQVGKVRATPALAENAELVRHGSYRFLRHPMYTALLIFASSYVFSDGSWISVQLWLGLLVVLLTKVFFEEKELRAAFPEYRDYAKTTSRLVPFVW